jgi:phenylacetate-CoA ligase
MLALLASYIRESGAGLGYQVRWVTTGAENLLPQQAEVIAGAFGTSPRQHYGMTEAVANFSECACGRLHIDEDFAAAEFVPSSDGTTYRVIGTNLSNPATPLIRYDTGDVVQSVGDACPCGRPGRFVDRVDGRKEDYVLLRDGTKIGRMDHVFKDMVHIREAQIYQSKPGVLVVRIVRGTGFSEDDERALLKAFHLRLGNAVAITVEFHDRLARTKSGKLRFVISEIPSGEIEVLQH